MMGVCLCLVPTMHSGSHGSDTTSRPRPTGHAKSRIELIPRSLSCACGVTSVTMRWGPSFKLQGCPLIGGTEKMNCTRDIKQGKFMRYMDIGL